MNILQKLNNLANLYEKMGEHDISNDIHKIFIRIAQSKYPELTQKSDLSINKASTDDNFTRLVKKSPEQLLNDIYETAEKINSLEPSEDKIQKIIEQMMSKDKKSLFDDKEDGRDLDGSKEMKQKDMDLMNHTDMTIEAEMNLEDAINNFDSTMYKVDPHGDWHENEWMPVHKYMDMLKEQYGHNIVYAPAAIDANHIAFDSPDGFQIVNMVHRSHWDTGK